MKISQNFVAFSEYMNFKKSKTRPRLDKWNVKGNTEKTQKIKPKTNNGPEIEAKLSRNWSEIEHKLIWNWTGIELKLNRNWTEIWTEIELNLNWNWTQMNVQIEKRPSSPKKMEKRVIPKTTMSNHGQTRSKVLRS